jgi:uncharacterized protein (TIGR02145 family)
MKRRIIKFSISVSLTLVSMISSLTAQDYCAGDSFTLNATDYVAGSVQWQYSYDGTNWLDFASANSLTYNFIPDATMYVRLQITDPECLPAYYTNQTFIELIPLPDIANAGEDQLDIMTTIAILNANNPEIGTGYWTIVSGAGGSLSSVYQHNASFNGNAGETYVLRWTVYNPCDFSQDNVTISFASGFVCGNDFVDNRNGEIYPTVSLAGKCWFAKNLDIGTMINGNQDQTDTETIQKYCYDNNNANCDTYGALYQWDQAMNYSLDEGSQGICPQGWHLPTDSEYKTLEISLGMSASDADLLNTWRGNSQNVGSQMWEGGSSGFETLFAGGRNGGGGFMYLEGNSFEFAYFWTSTEGTNNIYAMRRCLQSASTGVGRFDTFTKQYGFSVRCVKD